MMSYRPFFFNSFTLVALSSVPFTPFAAAEDGGQGRTLERISILEEKVQDLTAQVEELAHHLQTRDHAPKLTPDGDGAKIDRSIPQIAGDSGDVAPGKAGQGPQGASTQDPHTALKDDGVQDLYNKALSLLNNRNPDGAEILFKRILNDHPNHPLAINSQYWLGECYLARQGDEQDGTAYLEKAMAAFAGAYKAYRTVDKSGAPADGDARKVSFAKAPEALLKLTHTLKLLGRTRDACTSLGQVSKEFPQLPQNLKKLKARIQDGLVCGKEGG